MSKLARYTAKLFDANHVSAPNNDIAQFGSLASGSPAFTSDPSVIQSLPAYLNGWTAAVTAIAGGTTQPNLEDVNALQYLTSYFQNYFFQEGVSEWDSGTTYYKGSFAKSTDGNGVLYVSITDNNIGNGLTNTAYWTPYVQSIITPLNPQLCKAWVAFDGRAAVGTNCTIIGGAASYGVDHVYKYATGVYDIYFTTGALTTGNYTFTGSCGTQNGVASVAGDNNIVTGAGPVGSLGIRTASQLRIYAWETTTPPVGASEDSSCISIQVFGY